MSETRAVQVMESGVQKKHFSNTIWALFLAGSFPKDSVSCPVSFKWLLQFLKSSRLLGLEYSASDWLSPLPWWEDSRVQIRFILGWAVPFWRRESEVKMLARLVPSVGSEREPLHASRHSQPFLGLLGLYMHPFNFCLRLQMSLSMLVMLIHPESSFGRD